MPRRVTTVVIGAGQTGLAMSHCLTGRGIDHVVLERGEVAESWSSRRWDSLRLLTPNWLSRLPGYSYQGDDPGGFMSMPEIVGYLRGYADAIDAPVQARTDVRSVRADGEGFAVTTDDGEWRARTVVIASGPYNVAEVPTFASGLPAGVTAITPADYRNPDQLDDGGVLVVGAAATGVQLAEEIARSGRPVTLAVGGHVRVPRTYRGMDIMWWLDSSGVLDERYDEVDDITRARHVSSFQLVGSAERRDVDLNHLQDIGVELVGRLAGLTEDGIAQFSGSLPNVCDLADLKLRRLLDRFDEWATAQGLDREVEAPLRPAPTRVPASPPLMRRVAGRWSTVLWATGSRPEYPWLHLPVLDAKGRVRHEGGVTDVAGLYLSSANYLRRRRSSFIDGAGDDARELSAHLVEHLDRTADVG